MRILFLHSSGGLYGADRSLLRTATIFIEAGRLCTTLLPYEGPLAAELRRIGCEVLIRPLAVIRRQGLNPIGVLRLMKDFIISEARLFCLIQCDGIDIVHINTTAVLNGKIAGWLLGCRVLQHVREITFKPYLLAKILSIFIKLFSTRILAVSTSVKEHLDRLWSRGKEKVVVIPNGIDTDRYTRNTDSRETYRHLYGVDDDCVVIGCVGRIHFWKGQDYLLDVATQLLQRQRRFSVIIAGDAFPGYEHLVDDLKLKIADMRLQNHVTYTGFTEHVPELLKMFDIFILPSIQPDPLPTVVLEAMAARLPVVATAHGGALEMVIDRQTGFHVPWDDPAAVAGKLAELVADKTMRERMGAEGFRHVSAHYSLATYSKNIQAVFHS